MNNDVIQQISGTKTKRRMKGIVSLFFLMVTIAASILGSHQWKATLKVQRIFVEGSRSIPPGEIVQISKVTAGTPMYNIDLSKVKANILSQRYIKSVVIVRELPNALRIQVEERQPIAAISQQPLIFLDDDGVALPPYQSSIVFDVPLITGFPETQEIPLGNHVDDSHILHAIALLQQARSIDTELYHLVSEVHIEPDGEVTLYSSDAGVPIFLGKENGAKKLFLLKIFWKEFVHKQDANQLRMVDLRFEDQVIARWKELGRQQFRLGGQVRHDQSGQPQSTAF